MNKKKQAPVAYIITKLELGGAQKVCLSLFQELQKQDHPAWLISGTEGALVPLVQNHPNTILIPSLQRECSLKTIGNEFKAFFALIIELRKLKKKHPQLMVHTHSTKAGYLGRWAALFAGIKTRIHTIHGFGFHPHQSRLGYGVAYLLELITSSITSHYICVSTKDLQTGKQLLPNFARKSSLIRAAIEDHKFIPAQITTDLEAPFVFGSVSCFKKQKNLIDLLTAFEKVHTLYPHTRLELIGDGAGRKELEAWITEKKLEKIVTLHGWVADVATVMKTWNAFVMSSLWEGLPCAAVEARFLKLPVLAYRVGGMGDIIISGKNGFLYEPRSIKDLTEGMIQLLTNKKLYQELKEYPEDLSSFTLPAMILNHHVLYNHLQKN